MALRLGQGGLVALCSAALALIVLLLASPVSRAAIAGDSPCAAAVERDYSAPLVKLPQVREVPRSGELPIGPPNLSLRPLQDGLVVGRKQIGYELFLQQSKVKRRVFLDWVVGMRLWRVDSKGRKTAALLTEKNTLGVVANRSFNGRTFVVQPRPRPGLYLLQISLQEADGSLLRNYAEYLRVVRPTLKARLVVDASTFTPGQAAHFWIENLGTKAVDLRGEEFVFERYEGSGWVKDPGSPEAFHKIRLGSLGPGEAGFCRSFTIPADTPPGLYRLSKTVSISDSGVERRLRDEFQVQES